MTASLMSLSPSLVVSLSILNCRGCRRPSYADAVVVIIKVIFVVRDIFHSFSVDFLVRHSSYCCALSCFCNKKKKIIPCVVLNLFTGWSQLNSVWSVFIITHILVRCWVVRSFVQSTQLDCAERR